VIVGSPDTCHVRVAAICPSTGISRSKPVSSAENAQTSPTGLSIS